jgi:Protein of unknown function (DUF4038)/Putative collagen-binding domain of a collagenase
MRDSTRQFRRLAQALALILLPALIGSSARGADALFPLKVSADKRFLVDQQNKPFLVVGDAAWSYIVQLDENDMELYCSNRQAKGFNSIIVNLIEHKFADHPPKTKAGFAPFDKPGDFTAPNAKYFDFGHKSVEIAGRHGIVVWLAPAYLGWAGGDEGWFKDLKANGKQVAHDYGRFVAERFKDLPNIVWIIGGDYTPAADDQWTLGEIARGIREVDQTHLITAHVGGESAAPALHDPDWLDIATTYSYAPRLFEPVSVDYLRQPIRPLVLIETIYENEHDSTRDQLRRQAYWAMLSGACGQFFGDCPIWNFDGPGVFPFHTTWRKTIDDAGSRDQAILAKTFSSINWQDLVPDLTHETLVNGIGDDVATIAAARSHDGKLVVCYIPSTGADSRAFVIDLSRLSGNVSASWSNPIDGKRTEIDGFPKENKGLQSFKTPGDNGSGANDWVLILESK